MKKVLKYIDIFGYSINMDTNRKDDNFKVNLIQTANHKTIEGGILTIIYFIFVVLILTDINHNQIATVTTQNSNLFQSIMVKNNYKNSSFSNISLRLNNISLNLQIFDGNALDGMTRLKYNDEMKKYINI